MSLKNYFSRITGIVCLIFTMSFSYKAQCTFTGLNPNYCTNSANSTLTAGTPGGNFTGPGMVGSVFNPSIAGPGTHSINYSFCSTNYSITTGSFAPQPTVGTAVLLTDDATSAALPIGFSFQFYCNNYTTFYICSNGFITFTGAQGSPYVPAPFPTTTPVNLIAFPWTDLNPGLGGSITYTTLGAAPTRTLLVSFNAVPHHNGGLGGDPVTVQCKLMEGSNHIEIHTTTMPINSNLNNHLMGIQNSLGTVAHVVAGRNSTSNWSATNEMYRFSPDVTCIYTETTTVSPSSISVVGTQSICNGGTATLTASGNTTYTWSTGTNPAFANGNVVNVSPTSTTIYSVSATNAFGCVANSAVTVTVDVNTPTITIASSTSSLCLGKTATLTASGALTYTWTNGVTNGVSFFPSSTTTYTVSGQNGCGITTAVTTISVLPIPLTLASTPAIYCTNSTATINATTPATNFTWQPGNVTGTSPNIIVNPSVTTVYTVTVSDGTCSGTSQITLNANQVPTISIAATNTMMCPGDMITLTASGGNNYTWSPGGQTGSSIMVSPSTTSLYTATGDNVSGCTANTSQVISVGAQPTLVLSASHSTICAGSSATLSISGAGSYLWSDATTGAVNIVSPGQTTSYTVVGTHATSQCTASAQHNLDVYEPILSFTGNTVICNGDVAIITANGATSYTWNPVFTLGNILSDSPSANTIYSVSAMSSSNNVNCPVNGTVQVIVNPLPTVTSTLTRAGTCARETNTLTANGASTYTWVTTNTTVAAPTLTISSPVQTVLSYTLKGTSALGCQAQSVLALNISACTGLNESEIHSNLLTVYPNPNNGKFVIEADASVELSLYNELGQLIEKINLNEANAFKAEVKDLANGVYFVTGTNIHKKIIVQ